MLTSIPTTELIMKEKLNNPDALQRYFKLCLSYVEFISPAEISLETGRIMLLLNQYPQGLTRSELLSMFYQDYSTASFTRQNSLKLCLEKIIQRARLIYAKYKLTIYFCKENKKYYLKAII